MCSSLLRDGINELLVSHQKNRVKKTGLFLPINTETHERGYQYRNSMSRVDKLGTNRKTVKLGSKPLENKSGTPKGSQEKNALYF